MATTPADRARHSYDGAAVPVDVDSPEAKRSWYLFAISGVVSAIVGVLVLAYPDPSVELIGIFLGIDLLVVGALLLVHGASTPDAADGLAGVMLGIPALIAGLVVIRNPNESLVLMVVAFAIYLIVYGAVVLSRGLLNRERRWPTLARGAVLTTAGTVILCWPDLDLDGLALLAGITLLLQGVAEVAEAFVLRSERPAAAG
jgi:uncharacterized membrane protein HdeD (DUF308 family)